MNEFERKLAAQPWRPPPAELRARVLGQISAGKVIAHEVWTWRDWLWPSPQAWAALAALWLVFAAVSLGERTAPPPAATAANPPSAALLAYHARHDLSHVLEFSN